MSLGLCANTIDLGSIEDVGYVAEQDSYSPLNASSSAQMITGIAYPPAHDDAQLSGEPRFRYLFHGGSGQRASADDGDDSDPVDLAIREFRATHKSGADVAALNTALTDIVSTQPARILRLETELEAGRPLVAYWLDSLSAVELRNWIRMRLGVELTTLDNTNASSLVVLCEKMVSKLPLPS